MKVTDLQKEHDKWALALREMRLSQEQEGSDLASLERERQEHLVGACAENRPDAKESLLAVNRRIEALQGAQRDRSHAIATVSEKIAHISEELATTRHREAVKNVCELIDQHLQAGREKRLESLVDEFSKIVDGIAASERQIAGALSTIGKEDCASQIQALNNSGFSLQHVFRLFRTHLPDAFCLDFGLEQIRGQQSKQSISSAATGLLLSIRSQVESKQQR